MTKKKSQNTASAAKQPSPPPQRSRWPFVILAIVLVAAVAAAILLLQSAKQPATGASTATSAPAGTGRPQLVVDQEQIDFGSVPVNKMVKASFKLTNAGDTPLTLSVPPVAHVVEGCWPPRIVVGSTTLKPGQQTDLSMEFTMHAGMEGPHDFRVVVKTNNPADPQKELTVLSDWVR